MNHKRVLLLMIFLYVSCFTVLTSFIYHLPQGMGAETDIFHYSLKNTVEGRFMYSPIEGMSRFGFHISPFLFLFLPIYFFWASPYVLLFVQSLLLGLGALPVYWISREYFNEGKSLWFSFAYLMNPMIHNANLFDFHVYTLSTTFLLFLFYYLKKGHIRYSIIFLVLSLSCREDVGLPVFALGLFGIIVFRRKQLGSIIALSGLIWFFISVNLLIPYFSRGMYELGCGRYSHLGDSPREIMELFVSNPSYIVGYVTTQQKMMYLGKLFFPVGFISFFNPSTLFMALPGFLVNILSSAPQQISGYFQYDSTIVPFVIISAIYGLNNIRKLIEYKYDGMLYHYLFFAFIVTVIVFSLSFSLLDDMIGSILLYGKPVFRTFS